MNKAFQSLTDLLAGSVVIKGEAAAEAVLCSENRTYALKIVETTNSLLLVPPTQVKRQHYACKNDLHALFARQA